MKAQKVLWTPAILAGATGGKILSGNPEAPIDTISTDTRGIAPGHCFIALAGETHDGHAFVADAVGKGAGAVIVSEWREGPLPRDCAVIMVDDTLAALGGIARFHRLRFEVPVIAVSGSNGKTSTKEMIAAIFGQGRKVLKNKGNYNNLIGLPLTLLELNEEHRMAVVEMGINVPGEMERLARIGSPDAGVITNVHPAHLLGLESLDRIVEEKGALWKSLRPDGLAVVNLDDPRLSKFAAGIKARKITYSLKDPSADVGLAGQIVVSEGGTSFRLAYGGAAIPVTIPTMGMHHAQNALAAAAAAFGMGATADEVRSGLAAYEPIKQRMQCIRLANGCVVIDDTYNANPGSLMAAVEAVVAACPGKPFVAVLGEMRELGPESPSLHFDAGRKIGAVKPSLLVTLGEMGAEIVKGAGAAGVDAALCFHARSHEEAVAYLRRSLPECAWILVKGSRSMAMERIVEGITRGCDE
ncbi:MAG: UDP-N-acetylmuramoyl-tripeptide--D-alanyl-D-alanine ligase [Syntrophobacteraceae bacterium]